MQLARALFPGRYPSAPTVTQTVKTEKTHRNRFSPEFKWRLVQQTLLYESGRITEALQRIAELYVIEAEVRGCSAEQRLAARKARAAPLMQSLYDWIQTQMKTLSRHSDTAKAFAYLLKQWEALNVYCSNGQVEIDNNIAENALRGVAVGRKNWLFAGSDSGGEHAAVLYSLIGTCRLNNVEPEKWLRYVIEHIQDWPANRVRELLLWKVDLTSQ